MTGDGVNDVLSLKKADTGITVEGASNAARSAADIAFLAPDLSAIIDAIKTSGQIFRRMYFYVVYRIALSLGNFLVFGLLFLTNLLISTWLSSLPFSPTLILLPLLMTTPPTLPRLSGEICPNFGLFP
jgi:P-type E1-E2 ATPase